MSESPNDKKARLAALLEQKRREYTYPLSFGQQALWFAYQTAPESWAYNMVWPVDLHGDLAHAALGRALAALVQRHGVLRTRLSLADGEPRQTIHPSGEATLRTHAVAEPTDEALHAAVRRAYEQPFDLLREPVLRVDLFIVSPDRHVLLLTQHHIHGDADSLGLLGNELLALYHAERGGEPARLPPITATYADFVRAEAALVDSAAGETHLRYWRERLGRDNPLVNLPADYPRPALQRYRGASVPFRLSREVTEGLRALAQQEKTTLFSVLLAAFALLLHRYGGQEAIWVGTPTSTTRRRPEMADLIGYLVNPVVLTIPFTATGRRPFTELLGQTTRTVLEAIEHAAYPFPLLVRSLRPKRDASHAPLFQVMLDFKTLVPPPRSAGGLTVAPYEMAQMEGQLDLTLSVADATPLVGYLNYNPDLFQEETVGRLARNLAHLLAALVAEPRRPSAELPVIDPAELARLAAWNDTRVDYPQGLTLVDLFERQAVRTPDAVAVLFAGHALTYRELQARADHLAALLLGLADDTGVPLIRGNALVAVAMERSLEMVVALLGVLKAGCAYVPIDPGYPQARIRFMLEDSATPVVLSQSHVSARLGAACRVVDLDAVAWDGPGTPTTRPPRPADLAYVIYTSGSTGNPKGAMNAHVGIVNRLLWMQAAFHLDGHDRVLQKTPFSFDVSVWEFFWPLAIGAAIVMARPEGHKDPAYLVEAIRGNGVTVLHFVPSMLQGFLAHPGVEACTDLRTVICSGEALSPEAIRRFYALFEHAALHNLYGPTEAAVDVSHWPCEAAPDLTTVPIGRPIANTRLHVLDANQQPLPIGVAGELCIAGVQVGVGYWNRQELTAERFLEVDLFGRRERIYRTGDLVKWRNDGDLEYLGRLDHQVKLRGFRIELGEVEAALAALPGVKECLVSVRTGEAGLQQLVAYVVADGDHGPERPRTFKKSLKQRLPEHMVPALFVFLPAFPLSPNGKVDRKALPEPTFRQSSYVYPRDPIELRLAGLWEGLFHTAPISVLDDFFDLGGDSLLAIRLVAKINQSFDSNIPLQALFHHRTIEQLACTLRQGSVHAAWSPLVRLQPAGEQAPLYIAHASGGSAFDYVEIARLMGHERPVYALHPRGAEPGEPFHDSILDMARDYTEAVRRAQPKGPYLFAGWSFGGAVVFEMARLLEQAGESVPLLVMIDTPEPGAKLYHDDDLQFLMDRVPHYYGMNLQGMDLNASKEAQIAYVLQEVKLSGLFTPDIDEAYARNWFELYKHHNRLIAPYCPTGPVNSHILFLKPGEKIPFDVQMGAPIPAWERLARNGLEVDEAQGNHFNMISPVNTPALVERIKRAIERYAEMAR